MPSDDSSAAALSAAGSREVAVAGGGVGADFASAGALSDMGEGAGLGKMLKVIQ